MRIETITCDDCNADLTKPAYYLSLAYEDRPYSRAERNTAFVGMAFPPLDRPYHFCKLACLERWLGTLPNKKPADRSQRAS